MGRRKNPHPKRAVNARTVLKVVKGRKRKKKKREKNLWCCVRGFLTEDDFEAIIIRYKKKTKKRGEEEGEDDDVKRLWRIMCVPCDDDVVMEQNQMREEETALLKGVKRKRGHECDVCEKVFRYPSIWPYTCVRTRKRNRTNVMCARSVFVI